MVDGNIEFKEWLAYLPQRLTLQVSDAKIDSSFIIIFIDNLENRLLKIARDVLKYWSNEGLQPRLPVPDSSTSGPKQQLGAWSQL